MRLPKSFIHYFAHLHNCTLTHLHHCTLTHWHNCTLTQLHTDTRAGQNTSVAIHSHQCRVQILGLVHISRVITASRPMSQKGGGTACCRGCKCWPVLANWGKKRETEFLFALRSWQTSEKFCNVGFLVSAQN